ncbi:MAG: hypothetical protein FJZ58_05760, partial [Chlamydiae bacterium]|nr:hypothetical protein [Chlamydiota bacterium]
FLATASILFLYPLTFSWVAKLLPLRDSATLTRFPPLDRLLYLGTSFLRSSCALNLAVHMTTLPVCLFYFHKFPLASFLYNLCIPLATSFALFLFFCSLPCFLLCPPLAGLITQGNTWFLDRLLCIVQESPACLNVFLTAPTIPLSCLLLIQVSIFLFPFLAQKIKERKALVSPSQSIAWPKTALRQGRDSLAASVDRSVLFSPSTHE